MASGGAVAKSAWPPTDQSNPVSAAALHIDALQAQTASPPECTSRLVDCLAEIAELERHFIRIDPVANYAAADYMNARAFVVLAHGVIEAYLEGVVVEAADTVITAFASDERPRIALLALLAHSPTASRSPPERRGGGPWQVRDAIAKARQALSRATEDNQGLKERHVLSLVLPVGIKESDLGPGWLAHMTNLGDTRGRVAHSGRPQPGAATPLDPGDAVRTVRYVLPGLCRLDKRLVSLRDE